VRRSDVRPEDIARVEALSQRRLSLEEWSAYVDQPVSPQEQEETERLLAWFARRYPTPGARLAYARRAYRRWKGG
jgi:hypothetical protein